MLHVPLEYLERCEEKILSRIAPRQEPGFSAENVSDIPNGSQGIESRPLSAAAEYRRPLSRGTGTPEPQQAHWSSSAVGILSTVPMVMHNASGRQSPTVRTGMSEMRPLSVPESHTPDVLQIHKTGRADVAQSGPLLPRTITKEFDDTVRSTLQGLQRRKTQGDLESAVLLGRPAKVQPIWRRLQQQAGWNKNRSRVENPDDRSLDAQIDETSASPLS